MRDLQHWKDKVELSLDGRQVFFLFFGGAVLACMLFAVGVMTGRRLEARAIALETPTTEDPLAALDQLGDLEDEELTYHRALTRDTKPQAKPPVAATPVAPKPTVAPKPAAPKPATPVKPQSASIEAPAADEKIAIVDSHFTLQLSAFSARRDADDYAHRVQAAGYTPSVTSSELPGRGTMYRVRIGDYASKDAALAEKGAVDKKLKVSAYLAKL